MNLERIKQIQKETAYPNSTSVQQALLKVWNECSQAYAKQPNWVSVEDRLPDSETFVLISDGGYRADIKFFENGVFKNLGRNSSYPFVAHWQPLPEPPKQD